jgi:hypothetical protein
MRVATAIGELPSVPAIYAMYGGEDRRYVAYVGIGDDLRRRVTQHLVNRNSSATTETGAVRLHPDHISGIAWWEHPTFVDRVELEAAELVAFDVLEPTMRSRGGIGGEAKQRAADESFRGEMMSMFAGAPTGHLKLLTFAGFAKRLAALELRVERLENEDA